MVPAATASHHIGPPDWTGMGGGNVLEEVRSGTGANHPADNVPPTNGFDDKTGPDGDWFDDPDRKNSTSLMLDSEWGWGQYPYFVDLNAIVEELMVQAGETWEDRAYPGPGFFAAWWGWWFDKGSGGELRDDQHPAGPASGANPLTSSQNADGIVDDGHDNTSTHDTRFSGPWDEFIWRGENPWAADHGKLNYSEDDMFAFIQPGTHYNPNIFGEAVAGVGIPQEFYADRDDAQQADFSYDDRTTQDTPENPPGVKHANIGYGWVAQIGWWDYKYDRSLVMATEVTTAVNPDKIEDSTKHDVSTAEYIDHDMYSALHPAIEDAYRMTVWDPECDRTSDTYASSTGCSQEGNVYPLHDEGAKQHFKEHATAIGKQGTAPIIDAIEPFFGAAAPAIGVPDDASGVKPWPKEPDTGEEVLNTVNPLATNDDAVYGEVGNYYQQDPAADYSTYQDSTQPWMDAQPGVIAPTYQYQVQLRSGLNFNLFPTPATVTDNPEDRSMPPGHSLHLTANAGGWNDVSQDGWVGNLEQSGRLTSDTNPYRDGWISDPNDYTHNPQANEGDPTVSLDTAEWQGARDDSSVTATLCPVSPNHGQNPADFTCPPDAQWGTTGVYLVKDAEGHPDQQWNPRDDMVEDAAPESCALPETAGWFNCKDVQQGERLSRHITEGPINIVLPGGDTEAGAFNAGENVFFPAGNADFHVRIETTADVAGTGVADVDGETLRDVDYLVPADGS